MQEYTIHPQDGIETTVQLSDEDAKLYGLKSSDAAKPAAKEAKAPANKARTAANKSGNAG